VVSFEQLKAQPTISMVETHDSTYYTAVMTGVVTDKGGWTINGVGFIWDTLPMPTRQTGAKIKQAAPSCLENTPFSTFPSAANQYMASGKQYYVRAYAKKGSGTMVDTIFSAPMSVYVTDRITPSFRVDSVTNIGLYTATINSSINAINDVDLLSKKGIIYSNAYTEPILGQGTVIYNSTTPSTYPYIWTTPISALQSGSTYYARAVLVVKYLNTNLDTIYSPIFTFTTVRACETAPYNVSISDIQTTSAIVKFTPSIGQTKWQIDYGFAGHTPGEGTLQLTERDSVQINNLIGNHSYSLFVRAVCDTEYSDWSIIQTFTTRAPACAPVSTINAALIGSTYAKITWIPGSMTQNKWEVCFVKYNETFPDNGTIITSALFTPIGLIPQQRYKLRIRAICIDTLGVTIYSDWSGDYLFITPPSSLEDVEGNTIDKVTIYPNPTDGTLYFKSSDAQKVTKIEIYNALGERIFVSDTLPQSYTLDKHKKGVFLVKIYAGSSVQTEKVILN